MEWCEVVPPDRPPPHWIRSPPPKHSVFPRIPSGRKQDVRVIRHFFIFSQRTFESCTTLPAKPRAFVTLFGGEKRPSNRVCSTVYSDVVLAEGTRNHGLLNGCGSRFGTSNAHLFLKPKRENIDRENCSCCGCRVGNTSR